MNFLLQSDANELDVELLIVKQLIKERKFLHKTTEISLAELGAAKEENFKDMIPVGTIQFVTEWLNKYHGIERINPIEIPRFLRTAKFLGRDYKITSFGEIPKQGRFFIKDVSTLKNFSFEGDVSVLFKEYSNDIDKTHLFQVSELLEIISEYRVYIIDGRIENVCNYNGDPTVFPDMEILKEANALYSLRPDYPKSLTMDLMVTNKGTHLIEIHPFIACGLYSSLWGMNLLQAYKDGIDYVLRFNTELQT